MVENSAYVSTALVFHKMSAPMPPGDSNTQQSIAKGKQRVSQALSDVPTEAPNLEAARVHILASAHT